MLAGRTSRGTQQAGLLLLSGEGMPLTCDERFRTGVLGPRELLQEENLSCDIGPRRVCLRKRALI